MQQEADDEYRAARHEGTKPSLDLEAYTGTYGGDLYGNVRVELEGEGLLLHFDPAPGLDAQLTHWHYDTFRLKFKELQSLPEGNVNFILSPEGKVEELRIDVPNPDFDFTELEFKRLVE